MSEPETSGTVEIVKTEFRWKVENLSSKMSLNVGTYLNSPFFSSPLPNNCTVQWCLRMYPAGTGDSEDIGLYLIYCSDMPVTIAYSLSALDESTKIVYANKLRTEDEFKGKGDDWGYECFIEKDMIIKDGKSMLSDDALTISCEMFIPGLHEYDDDNEYGNEAIAVKTYYEELLTNGKFSDITVNVDGKSMLLHKNILSSISSVFQAMFDHDMRENNENQVEIKDIKDDVALEMFRYMYCRKVNNIENIAADLFEAADIYCIVGLKQLCEKSLLKTLNIDNALICLRLVAMYETSFLKPKVIYFVLDNLKELVKRPEYKLLSMECKDEIIMAVAGVENS